MGTDTRGETASREATMPPRRQPLSCARIVDAAIAYIDTHCIPELSMRKLGAELGVEAMSLYRYFPNKSALLDAVTSRVLAAIDEPDGNEADWAAAVRAWARSVRNLAREHPRVFPLLVTVGPSDARVGRFAHGMNALWQRAGLDVETADRAQSAIVGYTLGSTLFAIGGSVFHPPDVGDADIVGGTPDPTGERSAAKQLTAHDDAFEFGLELLLERLSERVRGDRSL